MSFELDIELSFHSLCKCAVFCSTQRCRGFAFMCLCVCFCLHPCFTQDYDCNDVEGKLHNILLTLCLSLYTSVCQPFTYSVAISSWSCLNPLEICVQSQYFKERACKFKQVLCAFWLLVCIHKLLFLLSDSTPPEHTTAFLYPLITCPQTPSSTLTPHPTSCHFTYITMDQTHISLMEPVPSRPQKGWGESGCTHAGHADLSCSSQIYRGTGSTD